MGKRQFGNARKLTSGRWQIRYRDRSGTIHQGDKTYPNKTAATKALAGIETDLQRGDWTNPRLGEITFGDWSDRWLATIVDLRPSTRERDEGYLRRYLLPRFGNLPLAYIDHMAVRSFVADLASSGLAPATVTKAGQILAKIMRTAVQAKMIPASPCDGVRFPRVVQREMRFLTAGEVNELADAIDPRYRGVVLLGCYGGLRAGEIFGLKAGRVDQLRRRIQVAEIVVEVGGRLHVGSPKTAAGRRSVPVPRLVMSGLEEHLAGKGPDELVFPSPEGATVRLGLWRRRIWTPAVRSAGLDPLRIHDMRHTAVALWISAGASPKEVAVRAGHASVSFALDRYGHLFPGHEDAVNDALDAMADTNPAGLAATVSDLRSLPKWHASGTTGDPT